MVMQEILNSRREFDPQDMRVVLGPELAAFAAEPSSTGWVYDQASSRYRNLHDGTFMSQAQMIQLRNDFAGSRGVAVQLLAQNLLSGSISLGEWQAAMAAEIKLDIAVEYAFGVGGIMMMNENDWTAVDAMNTLQNQFLDRFAQALKDGTVTEAQLFQRASMYVDSGIQAFERGQAAANDLDLPVYPGEDCDGLTNCRCFWSFDEQDDGSVDCTWNAVGDKNTCDPCQQHANDYDPITLGGPDDAGFSIPAATEDQPAVIMRTDPEAHARTILERNAGVAPTALFGWVTINGEHILISDVKTGRYSVGITSDEFHAAKIGDKAQSFELQSALSHLKATDVELSIGRGGWKSDEGKLFEENALALSFKDGSPEAVSREMAALGGKWGQLSALVQHYVRSGGEPQAQIDMGRRLSDAEVTDVADGLKEHFGGWTFAVDPASGSTKLVVSNVKAWGGPPDAEFKNQVHAVADSLKQGGLDTSVAWHQVENIPLDHLSSAKLSADGQVGRRDQGSSGEPERSEVPGARAEETGRAGTGGGSVPRGVPARLEEGILAKLSDAEKLRLTLEESPPAVAFGWVTIDGHPVLIGSPEEVASATATINQLRDPSTGHVVGAPAGAQTVQGLLELRAHLNTLATAGESQKDWYINSSKAILEAAQGNKADAEKLAQLVAIYSPKTSPSVDMNDALDAWYQWKAGVPIKVGIGARDQIASDLLYKNQSWDGRKTNNFYRNLMVGVDSEAANKMGAEVGQSGVTADIWMARAFNYTATEGAVTQDGTARATIIAPSGRQYDFIASEVGLVAKQKGWTPEQTQAAIWSATKAKSEGTNLDASGYDFSDALAERAGLVTPAVASAFQDGQGRDTLARAFGLVGGDNTFALPKAPQSSAGHDIPKNLGRVQEDARDSITAYTAARALLLKQPTATWTRMFPSLTIKAANATVLDAGRPLTASETSTLNQALGSALGRTNAHTTIPTDTGAWILNTTQPPGKAPRANAIDNAAFQKSVTSAVSSLSMDTTHVPGRYDGQSFTNDWTKNPDGKTYLTAIQRSGQADNFGAVASDLAARVAAAKGTAVGVGAAGVGAAFGWVTIGGNHILIGDAGGSSSGAVSGGHSATAGSSLTSDQRDVGKALQSAGAADTYQQGKMLEAATGLKVNLKGLDPVQTLPAVKALAQLVQDYPIPATLSHVTAFDSEDGRGWVKSAYAQYQHTNGGGSIGLNPNNWGATQSDGSYAATSVGDPPGPFPWFIPQAEGRGAAYLVTHEYGHAVAADIVQKAGSESALGSFNVPGSPTLSQYASTKATENFAEAFAAHYYGSTNPAAVKMGALLTKFYGVAPTSSVGFGWVTINGNPVLIGADGPAKGGAGRPPLTKSNLAAQKKLQAAKRMDAEGQGKLLEAAVGVQANLGKLDPKETLPGVKAIGQLIQDYPISTLAEIRSYSAGGDDGWTRMATAQYRQDVQGGVIGLNSSMWDKGNEFPPSESVAADSGNSGAWWPNVALKEPAAYIPVHEFGHAVMADIVARDPHALDEFHSAYPATPISGYAGSMGRATPDHNPERDAEAFAGYYYGSDHPDATAMGKVLTKVYGDAPRSTAKYPAKFDAGFGWVTIGGNHVLIGDDTSSGGGRTKSTELDGNLRADNPSEYVSKGFDTNPGQHQTPVAANRLLLARLASDQIGPEAVQPALSWSAESARNADNVASEVAAKAVFGGGKTSYLPAGAQPDPSRMAVLTSTYAVTQRALAEARIGDMSIYRGTSYTATNVPPEFAAIPPGKSATLSINTAPLSSFSLHEDQALKYTALFGGQGGGRYVISTTIPRKAIFATPQQGWGNPASHEVMVLGAERNYVVTHIAETPSPAAHSAGFKAEVVSLDDEPDNADWIRIINGVTPRAKFSGGPYEFGSTQINLPADLAAKVIAFQKTIDPADLGAGGLEDQPHITLLYGLDPAVTPDDVGRVVGSRDLVDVTFGKTSTFPAGNDGAPLFVTVTSPGLGRLHDALAKALPNKQTHSGYKPHVTIAYLTAAAAEKYADLPGPLNGKSATFDVIVHSSTDRTHTEITLGTEKESADFADGHWVTIDGNPVMIGHSSAVMTAARTIRSSAQERAATVTPMLQQLAAKQGSKLSGLQFAIKGEGSLADKIDSRSRLLGIAPSEVPIGDALRYTLVSSPAQLASNATETIAKLQSSGFTVNTDNYWVRGDTFNGIASDVKAPDGQRFELQFHTDESVATKERTHADYEILRDIDKTTAERFAAFQRMVPIADAMALPPNVMSVGTPTLAPFKP